MQEEQHINHFCVIIRVRGNEIAKVRLYSNPSTMEHISLSTLSAIRALQPAQPLAPQQLPEFRATVDAARAKAIAAGIDFDAPPFVLPHGPLDPVALADSLTRTFYALRNIDGPVLSLLWWALAREAAQQPLLMGLWVAGERIAADFDRNLGVRPENTYHTPLHTAEAMLSAHVLAHAGARQEAFTPTGDEHALLVLAALIHDWYHDGSAGDLAPFQMEMLALDAARPYLGDITLSQLTRLELMVLATDQRGPNLLARHILTWHRTGQASATPEIADSYTALAPLLRPEHARTAELAALLRDADLLPFVGLTPDYAVMQTTQVSDEVAEPLFHEDYLSALDHLMDKREGAFHFDSWGGRIFDANIQEVIDGHQALMQQMGEAQPATSNGPSIDLSIFDEVKAEADSLPPLNIISLESIADLRATLHSAGFFDAPPFTLMPKAQIPLVAEAQRELLRRTSIAEETADTLIRLHNVPGPIFSAITGQLLDTIGLRVDDAMYRAIANIARELDLGHGIGTKDDIEGAERNPFTNHHHILDLLLLSDLVGQRASQRSAPASSPLARGLILLAALVCRWHHTGKGNTVDGTYKLFHLQDRALSFAEPHVQDLSRELRQSLEILVRSTDTRYPYSFTRTAYAYHVGLGPRPDIPPGCDSLARLLGDPALCTLCARLNDCLFVPFVGLNSIFSARALVELGREIDHPLDVNFVRRNLIAPMLSRKLYPGEKPPQALLLGYGQVASFTTAEAQILFNPALHALLVRESKAES